MFPRDFLFHAIFFLFLLRLNWRYDVYPRSKQLCGRRLNRRLTVTETIANNELALGDGHNARVCKPDGLLRDGAVFLENAGVDRFADSRIDIARSCEDGRKDGWAEG